MITLKNLFIVLSISAIFINDLPAQIPQLEWAMSAGSVDHDNAYSIAIDRNNNSYTIGRFEGTVDFDPGPGIFNLTSQSSNYWNTYILKLDPQGNLIWAKSLVGDYSVTGQSIELDQHDNIHIVGSFVDTADFDPGPNNSITSSNGHIDIFILKLDSAGNFIWVKTFGADKSDMGTDIAIDDFGNVYATGRFQRMVDFDPGIGTFNLTGGSWTPDIFVLKLDINGNFVWADAMTGPGHDVGSRIDLDASNNVYVTGIYSETVDFDPDTGVFIMNAIFSSIRHDIFILKLDDSGAFVWAKSIGGKDSEFVNDIIIDPNGDILLTGYFADTVDFDPSSSVKNMYATWPPDIFLCKLDSAGDLIYVRQMGGAGYGHGMAIDLDQFNNIYIGGWFNGTIDFDPDTGINNITALNQRDIFHQKFDNNGELLWTLITGDSADMWLWDMELDGLGDIYGAGYFRDTADFDPDTSSWILNSNGWEESFVQKLNYCNFDNKVLIPDTSLCQGDSIILRIDIKGDYLWHDGSIDSIYTVLDSGLIYVEVNSRNCQLYDSLNVDVNPLPIFELGDDTTVCFGDNFFLNAGTYQSYNWQDGSTSSSYYPKQSGTYWVIANHNNCSWIDSIDLIVNNKPIIDLGNDTVICENENYQIYVKGTGSDLLWNDQINDTIFDVTESGIYWLQGTNECGVYVDSIHIDFINCNCNVYIPNAFTPDSDQLNDRFKPHFNCPLDQYELWIFDRWGQLAYHSIDPNESWDGLTDFAPNNIYSYRIDYKFKEGKSISKIGSVALIK
ncbi:MAG: gliding motility-associated C-terminal domain-containing protein [Flavobacteriales bacterium]|nr:gliding motility-associated C-terminal domain-containing protein [Flavobacteriales bacterium]